MKIVVQGLWHLGSVTSACLADVGFTTVGLDDDPETVAALSRGHPPLFEPGLAELVVSNIERRNLSFTTDYGTVSDADLVWVTYDTPVDEEDRADSGLVENRIAALFPWLKAGAIVLISSQLPVGTTRRLSRQFAAATPTRPVSFAYSPENLRLGKSIDVFRLPGRIIIGIDDPAIAGPIQAVLGRFCDKLHWVSFESAEMVKHALNAFLATSVTFINEIAVLCESVGADASEVEEGLRSDPRIGRTAYLRPGAAFSGGTLARDVIYLEKIASEHDRRVPLLKSILPSNAEHSHWPMRRLVSQFGPLDGRIIAVLGLSYKPGTDAIRRSAAVELCRSLILARALVRTYDPAVKVLPRQLTEVTACNSMASAMESADALVIATEWPEFRALTPEDCITAMKTPIILDQNRFLDVRFSEHPGVSYLSVGKAA